MQSREEFTKQLVDLKLKKEDKEWFRDALREAGDTYVINIPKSMTLQESHKIAEEVKQEKLTEKETTMQREFPSDFDPEIETSMPHKEEFSIGSTGSLLYTPENFETGISMNNEGNIMRQFSSGATRDTDLNKLDYEAFLSPLVLKCYAKYLNKHRTQADGNIRDSDNWQQGIPLKVYMKSLWRHFMDMWASHRNPVERWYRSENELKAQEEAICAVIFNASGYLHELLKGKSNNAQKKKED